MDNQSELEYERLKVLEKMVFYQLNKAKESMLNGETGHQEIKTGLIVEVNRKVNIIRYRNKPFHNLNKVNDCRFIGRCAGADESLEKLLLKAMNSVLENLNIGEHEATEMFIQWLGCAIIRIDVYCYRCNFSNEVVKNFEGVIGVIIMKRTINLIVTDPQILASTIFHQAAKYPKKTTDIINEVVTIINTISTTANKLEFIMPTSYIQNIGNKCCFCCKLLHEYASANPAKRSTSKTKRVKNKKKRKIIRKRQKKRKHTKKK